MATESPFQYILAWTEMIQYSNTSVKVRIFITQHFDAKLLDVIGTEAL